MEHDNEQSSTNSPAIDLLSIIRGNASEEVSEPADPDVQRLRDPADPEVQPLKRGRKPIYTADEQRQKYNAYHRAYYQRMKQRQQQQRLQTAAQIVKPLVCLFAANNCIEKYQLESPADYISFIDKLLAFIRDNHVITDYFLSTGMSTGANLHPVSEGQ